GTDCRFDGLLNIFGMALIDAFLRDPLATVPDERVPVTVFLSNAHAHVVSLSVVAVSSMRHRLRGCALVFRGSTPSGGRRTNRLGGTGKNRISYRPGLSSSTCRSLLPRKCRARDRIGPKDSCTRAGLWRIGLSI